MTELEPGVFFGQGETPREAELDLKVGRILSKIATLKKVTPEIGTVNWDGFALLHAINALFDELPKETK